MRRTLLFSATIVISAQCSLAGVSPAQEAPAGQPADVLHVQSRLVLEDVLVMDTEGNAVGGLPVTAFHLTDNGVAQKITSIEEGSTANGRTALPASLPPGVFTTAVASNPVATAEVLLVDTDDMALTDQMYLLAQLNKTIAAMPAGTAVSLFSVRAGRTVPLLIDTADHQDLLRVIDDMLPIQTHAVESKFQSALDQLMSVSAYLQQTPGRKNLLWFAGEFPLVSAAENSRNDSANFSMRERIIQQMQEALAEARIAVFPIDVRGVLQNGMAMIDSSQGDQSLKTAGIAFNPRLVNANAQKREIAGPLPSSDADRRSEMRALAAATGGRAYFLNNLADEIGQALNLGRSAYTLAYSPSSYITDETWHRIALTVDGGYTLSYRRGYLATWSGVADTEPRYKLTGGLRQLVDPDQRKPLLFQAQIIPSADLHQVTIQYTIPIEQLSGAALHDRYSNTLLATSYIYDAGGRIKAGKSQELTTSMTVANYAKAVALKSNVAAHQELAVPKGAKYLLIIVRDKGSQRTGSLLLQTRILAALPTQAP